MGGVVSMFNRGLVLGKFKVLHNGHIQLLDKATQSCNQLDVVIFSKDSDAISCKVRQDWINALYPKAKVYIHKYDHLLINDLFYKIPALTACNNYDAEFAGEDHKDDKIFEQSELILIKRLYDASKIIASPYNNLNKLPTLVRKQFIKNIAIGGVPGCGKTTLAKKLSEYYGVKILTEMVRFLIENTLGNDVSDKTLNEDFTNKVIISRGNNIQSHYKNDDKFFISDQSDICDKIIWDKMGGRYEQNLKFNIPDFTILVEPVLSTPKDVRDNVFTLKERFNIFNEIVRHYRNNKIPHYLISNDQSLSSRMGKSINIIDSLFV
jgi:cytidyltransferase-like protein